LDVVTFQLKP